MAVVTDISDQLSTDVPRGLVVRATSHRSLTYLDVADDDGIRTLRVEALPDLAAAGRSIAGMRRVVSVRFTIDGAAVRCTARGIAHRLPREVPVTLPAALGLVRQGIPAIVGGR